jgi:hypothetical protein
LIKRKILLFLCDLCDALPIGQYLVHENHCCTPIRLRIGSAARLRDAQLAHLDCLPAVSRD